jgi:hypothetical protein
VYLFVLRYGNLFSLEATMKTLKISESLHKQLKEASKRSGRSIMHIVAEAIKKYLATLSVLILFVGCSTVKYVEIDKPNYKKYQHEQVVRTGMSMKEALDTFGSPDSSKIDYAMGQTTITWVYYKKIFCDQFACFLNFSVTDKKLVSQNGFRVEFNHHVDID